MAGAERRIKMDIESNRAARKWSRKEWARRIIWAICRPLFRFSPRVFWGWRNLLLICQGARIGRHVRIDASVSIFLPANLEIGDWTAVGPGALLYNLGPLKLGSRVTISQRAHLCGGSHDYRDSAMTLLKMPITVGDEAWICAEAFVGPGVVIGRRAVAGARAVVVNDVEAGDVVAGNPARVVGERDSGWRHD